MCKHVAAVLYGVGARLDQQPDLLFVLRGVDQNELIAGAGQGLAAGSAPASANVLQDGDMAALFGLEMADAREFRGLCFRQAETGSPDEEGRSGKETELRGRRRHLSAMTRIEGNARPHRSMRTRTRARAVS